MKLLIKDTDDVKMIKSDNFNLFFNKKNGFTATWGRTKDEDPDYCPGGPIIADIEIATSCKGVGTPCNFCYKKNNPNGEYMTIETFKKLFDKLPPTITQIAVGIGDLPFDDEHGNPDMWKIFDYCRENKVIPNVTINGYGTTDEIADKLVEKCGATATSYYDKEMTFNTIKKLTDRGMTQANIHFFLSDETFEKAKRLIIDMKKDKRLAKMNALVFLSLKKKGRAKNHYTRLSQEKFNELVQLATDAKINYGFDSCSAFKYLKSVDYDKEMEQYIEPCESSLFSSYFNVKGDFYPCSFMEGETDWKDGIKLNDVDNFLDDLWNNERVVEFRNKVIDCRNCKQSCVHYKI